MDFVLNRIKGLKDLQDFLIIGDFAGANSGFLLGSSAAPLNDWGLGHFDFAQ